MNLEPSIIEGVVGQPKFAMETYNKIIICITIIPLFTPTQNSKSQTPYLSLRRKAHKISLTQKPPIFQIQITNLQFKFLTQSPN